MEDANFKDNFNLPRSKPTEHREPTVKGGDGRQHTLQEDGTDRAWPNP
jgi:hypothetical protein